MHLCIAMEQGTLLNISEQMRIIITCGLAVVAYLVDFLCCRLLIPVIRKIAAKTTIKWDNYLTGGKVLHYLFHLIPPVTFLVALPLLYPEQAWTPIAAKILYIYVIIVAGRLVNEFISSIYAISSDSDLLRDKPMKGVYQMLKVIVVCVAVILILGVLLERNFTSLLAGLGASAAVLMLIFKDTILGLVAGVQLSAHDMLRPGDWIIMEKYGVNGTVEEVTLNTVKVRNWDNTIVTVPPYALVSDSFQNWRGMRESEGRRVARSLNIDVNSIRFCTHEELENFASEPWSADLRLDSTTVNLGLFRTAAEHYLSTLAQVNTDLRILVRQLEPTSEGLPIQLYFFTREKDWVAHEHIAADVIEHIIATLPQFGLRLFQKPTGEDIKNHWKSTSRD